MTDTSEKRMESIIVFLKLRPNCFALTTGMTMSAPMRSIPTILMESEIVTAARTTIRRLRLLALTPPASANSSSNDTRKNSL